MPDSELILVQRWHDTRDADAFKTLALRHASMVFNTCRRILGNHADAEEVAQECFIDLALAKAPPRTHVAGWLHRVATCKATSRVRTQHRRRQRERRHADENIRNVTVEWDDLSQILDEALAELPEKLRTPVVMSFFEDQSHKAIAETLGLSRGTVTYRIKKGVEALRKQLRRRGIPVATASLLGMIAIPATDAAAVPIGVSNSIARLALAGMNGHATATAATATTVAQVATLWGGIVAMKKVIVAIAIVVAAVGTGVVIHARQTPPTVPAQSQDDNADRLAETTAAIAPVPLPETSPEQPPLQASALAEENTQPLTVDGAWRVVVNRLGERNTKYGRATFTTSGTRLRILVETRNTRSLRKATETMDATISGPYVYPLPGQFGVDLRGVFNTELTRLVFNEKGLPHEPPPLVFERVPVEELEAEKELKERKQEARRMFDLLAAFALAHNGMVPKSLEELAAANPDAAELFAKRAGRRIQYFPANATIQAEPGRFLGCAKNPPAALAPLAGLQQSSTPVPDQLAAKEAELKAYWGDHPLFRQPTFKLTYDDPECVVTARYGYSEAVVEVEQDLTEAELLDLCGHNLKQLAVVIKVFNSQYGDYDPGGWYSGLPEDRGNFPEPCTLTCPAAEPGTDGYNILFPASHADAYYDVAAQIFGVSFEEAKTLSHAIPLIYESHEHPGSRPGRIVTFYDGHAEFLSPEAFQERVAPFLLYR